MNQPISIMEKSLEIKRFRNFFALQLITFKEQSSLK